MSLGEDMGLVVDEEIVLNKFEGDDLTKDPIETIVLKNGVIVEHIIWGEQ